MVSNMFKTGLPKRFARSVYLFGSFTLLVASIILGAAILVHGQKTGFETLETLFLPLVMQPETLTITQTSGTQIHWNSSGAPFKIALGQAVVAEANDKEYLYLLGGGETFRTIDPNKHQIVQTNRVTHAEIYPDGSLGAWSGTSGSSLPVLQELPMKMYGFSATAVSANEVDFIYLLGGLVYPAGGDPFPIFNDTAFCAKLEPNGDITKWERGSNRWELPNDQKYGVGVAYHATVVVGKRIYLIGGMRRNLYFNQTWDPTAYVYSAEIGDSCKDLDWRLETELPVSLKGHTAVAADNGNIYVFGGRTGSSQAVSYRAQPGGINFGDWITQTQNLNFTNVQFSTAVQSGDYLYVIGGTDAIEPYDGVARNTVYRLKIGGDDNIQSWIQMNPLDPDLDNGKDYLYGHSAVTSRLGHIYIIGGVNADGKTTPAAQDKIYWTPLVFFSKESDPQGNVLSGQQINYLLRAVSNNVRDLPNIVITDTLPANLQLVSSWGFTFDGQTLMAQISELPINQMAQYSFAAVVLPPDTSMPNGRPAALITPMPGLQPTPTPEGAAQLIESNIRPTEVKGCLVADDVISSGTPRPKPTCTPTPVVTISATPSLTITVTPTATNTPTPTDTPTITPIPVPVVVVNQAFFCFSVEQRQWCMMDTAVNAPFQTYLPLVTK